MNGKSGPELARLNLRMICFDLGLSPPGKLWKVKERDLVGLAGKLSVVVGKDPPWTPNYLYNVIRGHLLPSGILTRAISAYVDVLNGLPAALAGMEPVTVYAKPGTVREYTIIRGRSRLCANPDCPISFYPRIYNQIYHDRDCRRSRKR